MKTNLLTSDHIEKLKTFINSSSHGHYAFVLVMKEGDEIKLHERTHNPCYGEMRKYRSTHGEEATQPEGRPGDLHQPFPKGEPIAVAVCWGNAPMKGDNKTLAEFMLSNKSPWIRGFNDEENIIHVGQDDSLCGIILTDTDVDSTVFVNLCKCIRVKVATGIYAGYGGVNWTTKFKTMKEEGLSDIDALITCMCDQGYLSGPYTYIMSTNVSIPDLRTGKSNDITGGTFRNRFDYNRKDFHTIFENPEGIKLAAEIKKEGGTTNPKQYAEAAKKVFARYG